MITEYEMLHSEMMDNIHKQETINNTIISVLGLSSIFSTVYESTAFILFIMFFSAVLLAKVQQCREVVYRISSYLELFEETNQDCKITWQLHFAQFKQKIKINRSIWKTHERMTWFSVRAAAALKNFGSLGMTTYLVYRLFLLIFPMPIIDFRKNISTMWTQSWIICILAITFYSMNVFFTFSISFDRSLRSAYTKIWKNVLQQESSETEDSPSVNT